MSKSFPHPIIIDTGTHDADLASIKAGEGGVKELHTMTVYDLNPYEKGSMEYMAYEKLIELEMSINSFWQAAHYLAHNSKKMIKSFRKLHLPVPTEWKNKRFACRLLKKQFTGI